MLLVSYQAVSLKAIQPRSYIFSITFSFFFQDSFVDTSVGSARFREKYNSMNIVASKFLQFFCICWSRHRYSYETVLPTVQQMQKYMMTSSNGNIFRVTGPLCGEFTGPGEFPTQRPVTRSFDVCFDLRLNKRLSKQPWGWWFETVSWSLWRHCNGIIHIIL